MSKKLFVNEIFWVQEIFLEAERWQEEEGEAAIR
jgi:hypothetical protein